MTTEAFRMPDPTAPLNIQDLIYWKVRAERSEAEVRRLQAAIGGESNGGT